MHYTQSSTAISI